MKTMIVAGAAWMASTILGLGSLATWAPDATIQLEASQSDAAGNVDVSVNARFVAFVSPAPLFSHTANGLGQVYVLDRMSGRITLESASPDGTLANGSNEHPRVSADARYVVFASAASNLVEPGTTPGTMNVFLRDRLMQATIVVSGARGGAAGTDSHEPEISDDGAVVVFESSAALVPGVDRNGRARDIYLFDVQSRLIERVSVDSEGMQPAMGSSGYASVNGDGRYVAFTSSASLSNEEARTAGGDRFDALKNRHVFLRDRVRGTTRLVSKTPDGRTPNGSSFRPSISADGRRVVFVSRASDLGPPDRNRVEDVYVYEAATEHVALVSRSVRGGSGDGRSSYPAISADGRYVVFVSDASDLACDRRCPPQLADINLITDIYRFDLSTRTVERVSGAEANQPQWWEVSIAPAIDGAGRVIAFPSRHPVDNSDLEHDFDLFIFVRGAS